MYCTKILQTERAASRIKELLAGDNAKGAIGIRLGVKRRT
jgi:Fe-S cluster assembly iron-binding protein IscA